ncbi:hypothetical protein N7G274_006681 [Stereocaulon virgatum]|uniref:alpha-glucosidase n=1 Tax=Stereocaulon virgatum TaxID=373712 RepID=A0ABR4A466_9LECA
MFCGQGWAQSLFASVLILCLLRPAVTVKHENFKTCEQSGFCKRNRAYADRAATLGQSWSSPYTLVSDSIKIKSGHVTGTVLKSLKGDTAESVRLPIKITFLQSGVARVTVDELKRQQKDIELRHGSSARKERYNEASLWALVAEDKPDTSANGESLNQETSVNYGPQNRYRAVINHKPFSINFFRDDELHVKLNSNGLLNMEHWRAKVDKAEQMEGEEPKGEGEDESTWWEETFGGNTDTKPKGPESVGMDITFPGYEYVYGIPGHASSLSLKQTRGGSGNYDQPYRLYNSDVFEYEMDSPMTLYGSIPFMQAHRGDSTVGVFWLNAAETWVDIVKRKVSSNPLSLGIGGTSDTETHWFSESGLLDVFVFLGPTPKDVIEQYSELTGYTQLPQQFAIGHHQCRWNYVSDEDVKDVDKKFDRADMPYDVIWLDIEYTDGKKYFTWDSHTFPDPLGMQKQLDDHERKLVIIIDPHIKNEDNYPVVSELKSKSLGIKDKNNNLFEGWCWPGSSHWIDCFNPAAIEWWKSLFAYKSFTGTAPNTFLWNDMNEPSVFNGPETTMPKDNIHYDNWEHRDLHNINGMTFVKATYDALIHRDSPVRRPFVLTRSYYAGSQRFGAMWTGDNLAQWSHLAASIPMILTHNIAGFPFSGADVGGFFGNPSPELLTRWYQAGAFYPFYRAHAHIDTRRREPYLLDDPYKEIITQALRLRYALLPAWYTAFHAASISGAPILQPHYYAHPSDEAGFALEDQFYVGSTGLLVKPVVTESAETVSIYLPPNELYYDYSTYSIHHGTGRTTTLAAPLSKIPILMQAGHIIPRKDRPRRSSGLMRYDPYTLLITLSPNATAEGTLYIDDGESYNYEEGAFIHRYFSFSENTLTSTDIDDAMQSNKGKKRRDYLNLMDQVRVEKIVVVGAPREWVGKKSVKVVEDGEERSVELGFTRGSGGRASWAVVRDPGVRVGRGWRVEF